MKNENYAYTAKSYFERVSWKKSALYLDQPISILHIFSTQKWLRFNYYPSKNLLEKFGKWKRYEGMVDLAVLIDGFIDRAKKQHF